MGVVTARRTSISFNFVVMRFGRKVAFPGSSPVSSTKTPLSEPSMLERESLLRKARFRHYQSVKPKKHLVPTHKQKFLLPRAHGVWMVSQAVKI